MRRYVKTCRGKPCEPWSAAKRALPVLHDTVLAAPVPECVELRLKLLSLRDKSRCVVRSVEIATAAILDISTDPAPPAALRAASAQQGGAAMASMASMRAPAMPPGGAVPAAGQMNTALRMMAMMGSTGGKGGTGARTRDKQRE